MDRWTNALLIRLVFAKKILNVTLELDQKLLHLLEFLPLLSLRITSTARTHGWVMTPCRDLECWWRPKTIGHKNQTLAVVRTEYLPYASTAMLELTCLMAQLTVKTLPPNLPGALRSWSPPQSIFRGDSKRGRSVVAR